MDEKVYDFVRSFIETKGYSPSYREIARGVGIGSTSSVLTHLSSLASQGRIGFVMRTPRTIHLKDHLKDRSNA
jgi:repressor LexA